MKVFIPQPPSGPAAPLEGLHLRQAASRKEDAHHQRPEHDARAGTVQEAQPETLLQLHEFQHRTDDEGHDADHQIHQHRRCDALLLRIGILSHLEGGLLQNLIHLLALPFSVQEFTQLHLVVIGQLHQHVQVREVAASFPARNTAAGDIHLLRQLLLGDSLFGAKCLEEAADFDLIHDHVLLSDMSIPRYPCKNQDTERANGLILRWDRGCPA